MTGRIQGLAAVAIVLFTSLASADVAVPKAGPLLKGGIKVDVKAGVLTHDGKTKPLADFLVIEKDDGTLVWAPDFRARVSGYERAVFLERRKKLVAMTKEAVRAKSLDVSVRLLKWVKSEGLSGKEERLLSKRVEKLARKMGKVNHKRLAPVLRDEKQLRRQFPAALLKRAKLDRGVDGLRLLRVVLDLGPDDAAAANRLLAERIPEKHEFESARAWLDWTLDLEPRGFKMAPPDLKTLKRAKFEWRPDLYAIMSDRVLVITSIRNLQVVAGCALRADAVARDLSKLFATPKPLARKRTRIQIHLFENRDNFHERAGYRRIVPIAPYFHFMHGRWDREAGITRVWCEKPTELRYWVAWTLVHEVARQWMWDCCPRFSAKQLAAAPDMSGYGVAVGLLELFADAPFDASTARFDLTARDVSGLRVLRKLGSAHRFPWRKFLLMDQQDVHLMNGRDSRVVGKAKKNQMYLAHIFQSQGAAVAHYLYNSRGGSRRRMLVEYVTNHYLGNRPKLAPSTAFGMTADELGREVIGHVTK